MHLGIDVREACRPKRAGKGQWTYGFVSALLERGLPLTLFTDTDLPQEWRNKTATVEKVPGKGFSWHRKVASLVPSKGIDVYVSPTSFLVPFLLGSSFPHVPVVHDLIAFRGEPHQWKARIIEWITLKRAVAESPYVCTISNATKTDLLARYPSLDPNKVQTVFAGPMRADVPRNEPDGKTILCIATLCPRKNQKRLIQAYAGLPTDLRSKFSLVLIGARGWQDKDIVSLARTTSGVEWRDYASNEEYEKALHTCTVFALPSLYEGFGMQILDALQRGIPILTSDRGSLKEVAGSAALLVNPESVESIREGLGKLLTQESLRTELSTLALAQAKNFSWNHTVDAFLTGLESAMARRSSPPDIPSLL
jgi:glycosyltransferase involved in cell wall biosynthesis